MRTIPHFLLLFFLIALIGLVLFPRVWSGSCNSNTDLRCNASTVAYVVNLDGTLQQLQSALVSQSRSEFTSSPSQTAINQPTPGYNGMDAGGGPRKRVFHAAYVPGSIAFPAQSSDVPLGKQLAIREVKTLQEGDHSLVQQISERMSFQLCCKFFPISCKVTTLNADRDRWCMG